MTASGYTVSPHDGQWLHHVATRRPVVTPCRHMTAGSKRWPLCRHMTAGSKRWPLCRHMTAGSKRWPLCRHMTAGSKRWPLCRHMTAGSKRWPVVTLCHHTTASGYTVSPHNGGQWLHRVATRRPVVTLCRHTTAGSGGRTPCRHMTTAGSKRWPVVTPCRHTTASGYTVSPHDGQWLHRVAQRPVVKGGCCVAT